MLFRSEKHIKLLCSELNVCENYLRTGIGEPFSKMPQTTMETLKKDFNLNDYDLNLIFAYLQLSTEKRAVIREFFENITIKATVNEIDEKVKSYRRELEEEKKAVEKSSVSQIVKDA